jgi:ketosteroid isomerase-like protein
MSQENVEVVRRLFEFDPTANVDPALELWHSDLDYRAVEGALDDVGVFYGREALRHYWEQWNETFDEFRAEPEQLIDAGEQVVAAVHLLGRMKDSEAVVDMRFWMVFTVRDGKIARGREYLTQEEALEVVGLSE